MSLHADLASLQSSIDQFLERLAEAAAELERGDNEDIAVDIYEVERHVRAAARRLHRTVQSLEP